MSIAAPMYARAKRWRAAAKQRGWSTRDVSEATRIAYPRCFALLGGDGTPREDEVTLLDALLGEA